MNIITTIDPPVASDDKQFFITLRDASIAEDIETYASRGGYGALRRAVTSLTPLQVVDEVKRSGLRGRGGAGFTTGQKWDVCASVPADKKYVICNAGEGDHDSHRVIEGMAIAAYAVGAEKGVIFFRSETSPAVGRMRTALEEANTNGVLGKKIFGTEFKFEIELRFGMGSFVCGEETALIQFLQGNRCEPHVKQPFPAERGLKNRPTLVNNIETFAAVPPIILHGAEWFASIGTEKSKGTKIWTLSGMVKKEGMFEVPFGTTLRQIIFDLGKGMKNGKFKAALVGGTIGGVLTEKHLDLPLDYETLEAAGVAMGPGSIQVLNENTCIPTLVKNNIDIAQEESCGKCTPCRIGTKRLSELLFKITEGEGTLDDLQEMRNLGEVMRDTSLCSLGRNAPNLILSTIDDFWDEWEAHVTTHKCTAGQCKKMSIFNIDREKCIGCGMCMRNCPVQAISRTDYIAPGHKLASCEINTDACVKCGTCKANCKFGAISII